MQRHSWNLEGSTSLTNEVLVILRSSRGSPKLDSLNSVMAREVKMSTISGDLVVSKLAIEEPA